MAIFNSYVKLPEGIFFLSVMHDIIMSKALGTSVPQCATAFQLTWMADRGTSPRLGKTGGIPGSMAGL